MLQGHKHLITVEAANIQDITNAATTAEQTASAFPQGRLAIDTPPAPQNLQKNQQANKYAAEVSSPEVIQFAETLENLNRMDFICLQIKKVRNLC